MQSQRRFSFVFAAALATAWAPCPAAGAAESAPPAASIPVKADPILAESQARLAWSLIEQLAPASPNSINISPASLASAFSVVALGSDPAMRQAIAKTLGFAAGDSAAAFDALGRARALLAAEPGALAQSADRVVFSPDNPPSSEMQALLTQNGAPFSVEDLSKPEVVAGIDAWVKQVTKGVIPEILGGPLPNSPLVVLNALHFKGKWREAFDPKITSPSPFTGFDGKKADVAMMRQPMAERAYRADEKFVGVDLPFDDERFSLVVVTTRDKPAAAKDFAAASDWLSGAKFMRQRGDLALPRFKITGRYELLPALDAMGLAPERASPKALAGFGPGILLAQVLQRASIEVNEEGAEAAAATAIVAMRAVPHDESLHMVVDKPFLFALRDRASGLILVAGYVGQPPQ